MNRSYSLYGNIKQCNIYVTMLKWESLLSIDESKQVIKLC